MWHCSDREIIIKYERIISGPGDYDVPTIHRGPSHSFGIKLPEPVSVQQGVCSLLFQMFIYIFCVFLLYAVTFITRENMIGILHTRIFRSESF